MSDSSVQGQGPYPSSWTAGGAAAAPALIEPSRVDNRWGDANLEHLRMSRGRYTAWLYVVIAFGLQAAAIGALAAYPTGWIAALFTTSAKSVSNAQLVAGFLVGLPAAFFTFRDRWRCIEAYASRACSGVMNLSLLYVPIIALVYANVRGFQKLRGR